MDAHLVITTYPDAFKKGKGDFMTFVAVGDGDRGCERVTGSEACEGVLLLGRSKAIGRIVAKVWLTLNPASLTMEVIDGQE